MVYSKAAVLTGMTGVALLGAGIAAVVFWRYLSGPALATVITSPPPVAAVTSGFNFKPVPVHNPYASFTYPASLHPISQQPLHGSEVAAYSYGYRDVESWQLTIAINRLAEPTLSDDSGYDFRKINPVIYQPSTIAFNQNVFTVMTDIQAGGFSKVAFNLHGTLSADISLYGDDGQGDTTLATAFQQVLQSWQWQQ